MNMTVSPGVACAKARRVPGNNAAILKAADPASADFTDAVVDVFDNFGSALLSSHVGVYAVGIHSFVSEHL
jgi:hypothetical protein